MPSFVILALGTSQVVHVIIISWHQTVRRLTIVKIRSASKPLKYRHAGKTHEGKGKQACHNKSYWQTPV
jgi:hypothetical protein